jgi:hypothetical protein
MAVSKRLRFEILRRDNHACRYCGAAAPDVPMTVDHVVPTALGGSDDPSNLVAACKDCNAGKSASAPDAPIVADVAADALRWAKALEVAANAMLTDLWGREELFSQFKSYWGIWQNDNGDTIELPRNWRKTVESFIGVGLPVAVLLECIRIAMDAPKVRPEDTFRYMCGTAWARVKRLQESTHSQVAGRVAATDPGGT